MKMVKNFAKRLWNDESGQGMAEYVLLIVVVVGVAAVFKKPIMAMVDEKMSSVKDSFTGFEANN